MAKNIFLTKSRFKLGVECPTKIFYLDRNEYANKNKENSFLEALAEGGFQVGALAKLFFPNGVEITEVDKTKALAQTAELLRRQDATVFEAAFCVGNLYLLADVVEKRKDSLRLIEVKAKSFDPSEHDSFYTKKGTIKSEWESYLLDIAFQKYVIKKCYPDLNVTASLMLVDKSKTASTDGINQAFLISKNESGRGKVTIRSGTTKESLGEPMLTEVNVDSEIETLWSQTYLDKYSFAEIVGLLESAVNSNSKVESEIGQKCKNCEFRCPEADGVGKRNGFQECWSRLEAESNGKVRTPVFDIWNFRKAEKLISQGIYFVDELSEDDISPSRKADEIGLSQSQRQWIQIEKEINHDETAFIDHKGLQTEMAAWTFPIHCIDFETTMVALPFNKGRRPYEQIAFQFSHHLVNSDGSVVHKTQFINRTKGKFPNLDFLRELRRALSSDKGTILRYAAHENTVLCQIRQQLLDSSEDISDKRELLQFIESITTGPDEKWVGKRSMIDLCELVKRFYFHPLTKGSNSIKKVLPAVLNDSDHLKQKYSKAIYGSANGIQSLNYKDHAWIEVGTDGKVKDPYKMLPPIFTDFEFEEIESLLGSNSLADGGAAMTAYSRMQFSEMSELEADRIINALFKYCELDTFAMVMIVEHWRHEVTQWIKKAA